MKNNLIISALMLSFLLSGCSSQTISEKVSVSPDTENSKKPVTAVSTEDTNTDAKISEEVFSDATESITTGSESISLSYENDTMSTSTYFSDIFTERDLTLTPDLSAAKTITLNDNTNAKITEEGIYYLTGNAKNFTVTVEADTTAKIQIVLDNAIVKNENFPVIYIKSADKCFITPLNENNLSVSGEFQSDNDINTDAVIYSKDDLVLNGTGTLGIDSPYGNGISAKDDLKATGGIYNINCALDGIEVNDSVCICGGEFNITSYKDAIHCENDNDYTLGSVFIENGHFNLTAKDDGIQAITTLQIDGGTFNISAAEGLESTFIQINDGDIYIESSDDGINAAKKASDLEVVIEINGGKISIVMGSGDTDGIDSNGNIIINGGIIDVKGNSTFDYDSYAQYNGGTIIVNGVQVDSIPQSMMGGKRGGKFF